MLERFIFRIKFYVSSAALSTADSLMSAVLFILVLDLVKIRLEIKLLSVPGIPNTGLLYLSHACFRVVYLCNRCHRAK